MSIGTLLLLCPALRQGPEDAADLTQAFFAQLIEKEILARADPERGWLRCPAVFPSALDLAIQGTAILTFFRSSREVR